MKTARNPVIIDIVTRHCSRRLSDRAKRVYVGGLLFYSTGMFLMAITRHKFSVIFFSWAAGVMYSTMFTMPYLLIAHYHSTNTVTQFTLFPNPLADSDVYYFGDEFVFCFQNKHHIPFCPVQPLPSTRKNNQLKTEKTKRANGPTSGRRSGWTGVLRIVNYERKIQRSTINKFTQNSAKNHKKRV